MPLLGFFASRAAQAIPTKWPATKSLFVLAKSKNQFLLLQSKTLFKTSAAPLDNERQLSRRAESNFDTLGSWNNRMDLALNIEESIKHGTLIPQMSTDNIGISSVLGRRKENEDRFQVIELAPNILMFAIFDGHGGKLAADYAANNVERHIRLWLERGEADLQKVLRQSFIDLNNSFTRYLYHNCIGSDQALSCGTTATVCLLRNSHELVVAHVGDSRALLCRAGKVVRLTQDHRPEQPKEKERIKNCNGRITFNSVGRTRVNGRLDMSRSIGDVDLKPFGVIAEPDTRIIGVKHGKDAFLVLTTDGVNYVISDQEVVDIIAPHETPSQAAAFITDEALHFGSEDNATALIVPFGAWGKYGRMRNPVPFTFGRNIIGSRYS